MSESLEALARELLQALRDERLEADDLTNQLDEMLTNISKVRADHPDKLAHAHLVAQAYPADFRCDEEPIMELGTGTDVWVQCWMLVKTDPETGSLG